MGWEVVVNTKNHPDDETWAQLFNVEDPEQIAQLFTEFQGG